MAQSLPSAVVALLDFQVAPDSPLFVPWSSGIVTAVPISLDGARVGWVWWHDDDAAAGWLTDHAGHHVPPSVVRGLVDAVTATALAGSRPSDVTDRISRISRHTLGDPLNIELKDLWITASHPLPDGGSMATAAVEALTGNPVSGPTLDAGLRGLVPLSDAMRAQVDSLDSALARKPVPERIVAVRGTSLAAWPGEPEALIGHYFVEHAYFPVLLGTIDPVGHDAVVHLAIPPGVPAIYTRPEGQPDQGYLVLGRDLTWTVTDAQRAPSGTWVLSARVLEQASK